MTRTSATGTQDWLIATFSPKTANNRIGTINVYLDFIGYKGIRLKVKGAVEAVSRQRNHKRAIRNVKKRKGGLKAEEDWFWYYVVRVLICRSEEL